MKLNFVGNFVENGENSIKISTKVSTKVCSGQARNLTRRKIFAQLGKRGRLETTH